MLVLTRKPGERILIGDDIIITVMRSQRSRYSVAIGIDAPESVKILREELETLPRNNRNRKGGDLKGNY